MRVDADRLAIARRALLVHALALPALSWSQPSSAVDYQRLRARYILMRPGETTFEAASMIDSNPINKQMSERGLTDRGREQVERSVDLLRARGVTYPVIFYDSGVRATQTAEIIAQKLGVPKKDVEPEYRWLEARGYGALDGADLVSANAKLRALDALDIDNAAEESDDGTPADSVNEMFSRVGNTVSKIEQTYGGGDFIVVGGDSTVLSVFAAAACGVDLREHGRFELRPGEFFDLRELVSDWKAGSFVPVEQKPLTKDEVRAGREVLEELGPKIFGETGAGSCLCCDCRR